MNDTNAPGLIGVFARHRLAGNLLMVLMIMFAFRIFRSGIATVRENTSVPPPADE